MVDALFGFFAPVFVVTVFLYFMLILMDIAFAFRDTPDDEL